MHMNCICTFFFLFHKNCHICSDFLILALFFHKNCHIRTDFIIMRKLYLILTFLFPVIALAQNADSTWFVNNYTKKEVSIPMRDGIKLFTSIYLPKDQSEKHPILMTRTPYSCAPYGTAYRGYWRSFMINY